MRKRIVPMKPEHNRQDERPTNEGSETQVFSFTYDSNGCLVEANLPLSELPMAESDLPMIVDSRGNVLSPEVGEPFDAREWPVSVTYTWTGRDYDVDSSLQYNMAGRFCDPSQGRLLEEDA
jgi:hypothetical protein